MKKLTHSKLRSLSAKRRKLRVDTLALDEQINAEYLRSLQKLSADIETLVQDFNDKFDVDEVYVSMRQRKDADAQNMHSMLTTIVKCNDALFRDTVMMIAESDKI